MRVHSLGAGPLVTSAQSRGCGHSQTDVIILSQVSARKHRGPLRGTTMPGFSSRHYQEEELCLATIFPAASSYRWV